MVERGVGTTCSVRAHGLSCRTRRGSRSPRAERRPSQQPSLSRLQPVLLDVFLILTRAPLVIVAPRPTIGWRGPDGVAAESTAALTAVVGSARMPWNVA